MSKNELSEAFDALKSLAEGNVPMPKPDPIWDELRAWGGGVIPFESTWIEPSEKPKGNSSETSGEISAALLFVLAKEYAKVKAIQDDMDSPD